MKQGTGTGRTGIQILSSIASNLCSARLTDYGINMLRTTIQDHEFVYSAFITYEAATVHGASIQLHMNAKYFKN